MPQGFVFQGRTRCLCSGGLSAPKTMANSKKGIAIMNVQKEVAACLPEQAAGNNQLHNKLYRDHALKSTRNLRELQVEQRRAQMPRSYRAVYDRAVKGRSLRAAINSFCLECVCWQIEEIRNCTDLGCPHFSLRPYQDIAQTAHNGRDKPRKSTNSATGRLW